jgi:hypothetical protein
LIITGIVVLVVAAMFVFDSVRAKTFHLKVIEMSPNPAVADGQTPVEMTVKLVNLTGKPVKGHAIYALATNGGMFHSTREITDGNGVVKFTYYPYKASNITELKDAVLDFIDESNSIFIEIGTKTETSLALTKPETKKVSSDLLNGIFGE